MPAPSRLIIPLFAAALAAAGEIGTFEQLRARFAAPGPEFTTAPLMVWNGEVTEAAIDRQLAEYKAQGIEAFFIHPRPGLITEYLSPRWEALVRHTAARALELGMKVWLYDENSYPSGFAGGHVPDRMPESFNQGQGLRPRPLDEAPPAGRCKFLLQKTGSGYLEVSQLVEPGQAGEYICYELTFYPKRAWHGGFSYVDLLVPGVTEKFIELTMGSYERALGEHFGALTPGIFTDEPEIIAPTRDSIRWTPDLFDRFEERWGYDLRPHLPALSGEAAGAERIRHNYYSLLLDLFIERWSKPWAAYTAKKKLHWTGHYWEHAWPDPAHGPDNMAMYAWHSIPGIDMLFNQFSEGVNAQFGNIRAVKELSSAANQLGRQRTLSEAYGGAGWDLRFEDMKRLGDWQAALGVNFLNQHLTHQTLAGARKHDYPPSFSYHTPWWPRYGALARYFARLSLALSAGEQVNRVVVLEPTTTAWMYASVPAAQPAMMEHGRAFQAFITALEYAQVEFDLASERIMRDHGRAEGAGLRVGRRVYEVLVLPPGTRNLDQATARLVAEYVRAGGRVVSLVDPPAYIDGSPAGDLSDLASAHAGNWKRVNGLDEALPLLPASGVRVTAGRLLHQRRRLAAGELLFFANSSLAQGASATINAAGAAVTELDALHGVVREYPSRAEPGGVSFSAGLAPGGSLLVFVGAPAGDAAPAVTPPAGLQAVAPAARPVVSRLAPNVLRLDYCDLEAGGQTMKDIYYFAAQEAAYRLNGVPANPWNSAVQFKQRLVEQDRFPAGSGFTATFRFTLAPGVPRKGLRAAVERPALYRVHVNGKPVEPVKGAWWLDTDTGVFDIGPLAADGENTISLAAAPMSIHAELEPVHLLGDFGVEPAERGWRLAPPAPLAAGDWVSARLPFYPDRVAYAADFPLAAGVRHFVRLPRWHGTVAEVRVNGKPAGIIAWQPYELDITPHVRKGRNRVEVIVTGSLKNLLGPHHGKISRGLVSPGSFRGAPANQPPGSGYDLDRYGLLEDFAVLAAAKQ